MAEIRTEVALRARRLRQLAEQVGNDPIPGLDRRSRDLTEHLYGCWQGILAREEHRDDPSAEPEALLEEYMQLHPGISPERQKGFLAAFEEVWCSECGCVFTEGMSYRSMPRILCQDCLSANPALLREE